MFHMLMSSPMMTTMFGLPAATATLHRVAPIKSDRVHFVMMLSPFARPARGACSTTARSHQRYPKNSVEAVHLFTRRSRRELAISRQGSTLKSDASPHRVASAAASGGSSGTRRRSKDEVEDVSHEARDR